jgi:hypothetical protein
MFGWMVGYDIKEACFFSFHFLVRAIVVKANITFLLLLLLLLLIHTPTLLHFMTECNNPPIGARSQSCILECRSISWILDQLLQIITKRVSLIFVYRQSFVLFKPGFFVELLLVFFVWAKSSSDALLSSLLSSLIPSIKSSRVTLPLMLANSSPSGWFLASATSSTSLMWPAVGVIAVTLLTDTRCFVISLKITCPLPLSALPIYNASTEGLVRTGRCDALVPSVSCL